ncbi:hypothetical protein [Halobaculum magnesiiphilum]|uniref:Uncharacterized protein n=1 Tax=Halobaculum magnesiiphilum TaxID=1017351 RepID=A0A8T8WBE1_9EURY|nr:hypothetical protein [Halobaculum magnesiiphilum]QZP37073.1 hypothetical protein K6T50_12345 [Halobaculum magnesiiphilum]
MHRTHRAAALVIAILLATAAIAPTATVAQSDDEDDGLVGDLLDGEDDGTDWSERVRGAVTGFVNRVTADTSGTDAATAAADFQAEFNANNATLQSYANNRSTAGTDFDVLAVTFDVDDESETVYLVADVADGDYQNATIVDATDRTVDEECALEDHAATNADDEVANFTEEFASTNDSSTDRYLGRLAAEYGGAVECSFDTER